LDNLSAESKNCSKVDTINPDGEEKQASQERQARLQGARASDAARDANLEADLKPTLPPPSAEPSAAAPSKSPAAGASGPNKSDGAAASIPKQTGKAAPQAPTIPPRGDRERRRVDADGRAEPQQPVHSDCVFSCG